MTLRTGRPAMVVIGTLAVVALFAIARLALDPGADGAGQAATGRSSPAAGQPPTVPVVNLNLERLQASVEGLPASERDPFRFRPKPPPAQPPPSRTPVAPVAVAPPEPTGPPPPPPISLKFFGVWTMNGMRVAAFSDARGNTFNGKEGDILEGRYRLLRIGPDSVDLAYLDGRGRQSIRLTGQ